tara:strand:+ start:324 stop:545 length:222 start_codon:yes stop_codon:yes gene_type:complete
MRLNITEKNIPPNNPSNVLFGLILYKNFVLPNNFPIQKEKISKIIIMNIIKLKIKIVSLLKLKVVNEKKEINK